MTRLLLAVVALVAAAAAPVQGAEHPNFTGTWKMNEASRPPGSKGPREVVLTIRHQDPAFSYEAKGRQANYAPFSEAYAFTTDGKPPVGEAKVKILADWEGASLKTRYLIDGEEVFVFTYSLSTDGKQLFREGALRGKPLGRDTYDRQ